MEQKAYRTLLLRYPLEKLPPEGQARIAQLLKMQQEFRQWAEEWVKNKGNTPAPAENPLKYFAEKFLLATKALEWPRSHTVRHGFKPPPVFSAWLRLNGERDVSRGVFVDLPKREVRARKWRGQRDSTIALRFSEGAAGWILERVEEGAVLAFAAV